MFGGGNVGDDTNMGVSLAIAIGLPGKLADGSPFPERHAIIFISVVVVLFTLLGQGLTLPWLVRRLNVH